jgi:hypothetical protein
MAAGIKVSGVLEQLSSGCVDLGECMCIGEAAFVRMWDYVRTSSGSCLHVAMATRPEEREKKDICFHQKNLRKAFSSTTSLPLSPSMPKKSVKMGMSICPIMGHH